MNDEIAPTNTVIPPPPQVGEPRPPIPERPKPALVIGILFLCYALLLLFGAGIALFIMMYNAAPNYHAFILLQAIIGLGEARALVVIGIGLICVVYWARHAAILLLLFIIAVKVYFCFTSPEFTLADLEKAGEEMCRSLWVFLFYGFLINRLSLPAMKTKFMSQKDAFHLMLKVKNTRLNLQ